MTPVLGCRYEVERRVGTRLFGISANNSGSTFLEEALAPELEDLDLRRRLWVKGRYHEMLTDMNARQIARLDAEDVAAFNRVFRRHEDLLARFGYAVMEGRGDPVCRCPA